MTRRRLPGRLRAIVLASAAVLVASSCGGPPDPLDVAVKEVPSDIVLGSEASGAPAPAPVPPAVPVVVGPGVPPSMFAVPVARPDGRPEARPTPPTTARPACPTADPLAAPRREARGDVTDPPRDGPLPFRVDGTFRVSGANARDGRFPPTSTRTVQAVATTANGFTYEVAAELAGTTTTTRYQVVRRSDVPGEAGIHVVSVTTRSPSGATARFQPALPIKLVDLPMVAGTESTDAGTDPGSATTVAWTTTVGQRVRVDACGTLVDAITLELTDGRATGPSMDVEFSARFAIATQHGGISVADTLVVQGREGLDQVSRRIVSTVSVDPDGTR